MEQGESLVRRALRGDHLAFCALVEEHWTPLVRLARSVVGEAEAEDAVQDALLVAWRQLGGLRNTKAFGPWLTRMVLNGCLRRTRRRPPWLSLAEAPEPQVETRPDCTVDVERVLAALAPRQRAVLHLTVIEGLTDSEIAAAMNITAGSVRSHRRRARQSLDRLLKETGTS